MAGNSSQGGSGTRSGGTAGILRAFLLWREASIIIVAVVLALYFWIANANFVSNDNIQTLSQFIAAWVIIGCGEIMLLICGEIDLSVGQLYAMAPFLMNFAYQAGVPLPLSILIALALCSVVGYINGFISVRLEVPSFVTTLGMLFVLNGLTLTISRGFPVTTPGSPAFAAVMGAWGYSEILWALAIVLIMHVVLRHTRWGLHTIALGGNTIGAREAGINVDRLKLGNFMLTSVLGGFTGIIEAFRIGSTDPLAGGTNVMFLAVAAGVIGGTPLAGGSGTILGGFVGALVLGILQDGFTLQGINAFTFDMIIGGAILIAMISNVRLAKLRSAGGKS